ncbi:MAG: helix-turn-helix transcriptional regulator [Acetatifactor sp.]|nr:helix-turn-helix transcriptional regulator [Acetatifactor sp.]
MKLLLLGIRREKKITLVQLAELTGLSKTTLNEFENERRMPNLEQLERIAMALDMRMSDLYESDYK